MARVLIERETIYQEEVDLIMAGKTAKEVMEYMDNKEVVTNPFARAEKTAPKAPQQEEKAEETEVVSDTSTQENAEEKVEEKAEETSTETNENKDENSNDNN